MIFFEVLRGAWETIRETLPDDARSAGSWLAGFCWAFALFWAALIGMTWLHCAASGRC